MMRREDGWIRNDIPFTKEDAEEYAKANLVPDISDVHFWNRYFDLADQAPECTEDEPCDLHKEKDEC